MGMRKYMGGVTLMELMIVVVIIGILTAIAYPNYREFAARAKRTEARALLMEIAVNQERWYLQNNTYGSMGDLGYDDPQITDSGSYSVAMVGVPDTNNFTARATYVPDDAEKDKCLTFDIDGRGAKSSLPDGNCWTRTR